MGCRGIFGRRSMTPDLLIRTGLRQGRLWLGAGILACISGVVALQFAATGLVHGNAILQDLGQHGVTAGKGWAVVGVALVASVLQWLRSRREALPSGPFLLAASVLAVLIYAGYARAFDLQWINDFADMWRLAVQEVAQGQFNAECAIPEVAACHLKAQRTLPILWPAVYLWGHRASLVPLLNGGLLLLMMLMGWDQARSAFGPRAAQVFAVLWVGCAETVFALRIPTHDLWGLFFIALLSWLLVRWFRQAQGVGRSLVYGVALAIPVLLLEVQRELGLVALAALACTVLLLRGHRPLQRSLACALLACTLAYAGGMAGLKHAGMLADDGETAYLSRLRTFALIPAYSGATWLYGQVLGDSMLRPLPAPAQRELARAAVLSDFAEQPLMRIAGVAFKASQLAPLGNQTYFYQPGLQQDRPGLFGGFEAYNRLYCVLLAALVLAVLPRVLRRPLELAVAFPLAFMGVLIGGLLTVGETQTRYLFPLWFFAPLVVASGFGQAPRGEAAVAVAPQPMARALLVGALAWVCVLAVLWRLADGWYTSERGRILTSWSFRAEGLSAAPPESPQQVDRLAGTGRSLGVGQLGFTLRAAKPSAGSGAVLASMPVCVPAHRGTLRFAYVMPYTNPAAGDAFTLSVTLGGRTLWSRTLPDDGKVHDVQIDLTALPKTCSGLEFSLRSHHPLWDESWAQASRTEIYFPRFTRH